MARGWESKSVESQIEAAESRTDTQMKQNRSPQEIAALREREGLELSRKRILHEMETCQNPRYRVILSKGLADLEAKLAKYQLRRAAHGG
jgi:hypothetical protein